METVLGKHPSSPRHTFIVGAERSGTTVFRLMLAEHSRIGVCSAFEYLVDLIADGEEPPPMPQVHESLQRHPIFQAHGFEIDPDLDFVEMCESFCRQTLERDGATHFVALVHRHFVELPRIWPNARYIHVLRDPRDVAKSAIGMGWAGNTWHGVRGWIHAEQQWDSLRSTLNPGDFIDLRYEELVRSPRDSLVAVCDFLNLPFETRMLEYDKGTTYSKPDESLIEQWKRKQTVHEVARVEARLSDLLTSRGYQPSGFDVRFPGVAERAVLAIHNRLARIRFNIRRLGPSLWLADLASRRLGLRPWQRRLEPRLIEARQRHLK